MQIQPAQVDDAESLTDLHLDVWEEAYGGLVASDVLVERRRTRTARVERWRAIIPGDQSRSLLAWDDDRLVGFVSTGAGRDDPSDGLPDLEVWALYVRAEVYGQGVGHALLAAATGDAPAYLWVLDGNRRAIAFYERQGFRLDGVSKTEPVGVEHRMVREAVGSRSVVSRRQSLPSPAPGG